MLGATCWIADGELFVLTDQKLSLREPVVVTLVLPDQSRLVRIEGRVAFLHDACGDGEADRDGIGLDIPPVGTWRSNRSQPDNT